MCFLHTDSQALCEGSLVGILFRIQRSVPDLAVFCVKCVRYNFFTNGAAYERLIHGMIDSMFVSCIVELA